VTRARAHVHARSVSPATTAAGGFDKTVACTVLNRWLRVRLLLLSLPLRGGRTFLNIMLDIMMTRLLPPSASSRRRS
jgi:hypothetical protein